MRDEETPMFTPMLVRMQPDYSPSSRSSSTDGGDNCPETITKRRVNRVATTLCVALLFVLAVAYIETESTLNEDRSTLQRAEAAMLQATQKRAKADLDKRAAEAAWTSLEKQKRAVADVEQQQAKTRDLMAEESSTLSRLQRQLDHKTAIADEERAAIVAEQQDLIAKETKFWRAANKTMDAVDQEIMNEQQLEEAENEEENAIAHEERALDDLESNGDALVSLERQKSTEQLQQQQREFKAALNKTVATQQQEDQKLTQMEQDLRVEKSGVIEEEAAKSKRNRVVCTQEAKLRHWKQARLVAWNEAQGGNIPGAARENTEYPCDPIEDESVELAYTEAVNSQEPSDIEPRDKLSRDKLSDEPPNP